MNNVTVASCPHCRYPFVVDLAKVPLPKPGQLTVCCRCGALARFGCKLNLHRPRGDAVWKGVPHATRMHALTRQFEIRMGMG